MVPVGTAEEVGAVPVKERDQWQQQCADEMRFAKKIHYEYGIVNAFHICVTTIFDGS